MKPLLLFLLFLFSSFILLAQKKPALPAMPDLAALQKMTPAQQEAYRQKLLKQYSQTARQNASAANVGINEVALPDFALQPPPKDFKRLALIPKNPPTLIQLADGLRQSKKNLEAVTPKPILDEVKRITETQTPAEQHNTAVAVFMAKQPTEALLISMHSTLASTDQPAAWNNLAAMFNMSGLEHKAVPILMNQLQGDPTNATLLNNLGQAYLGMGDMISAEHYFTQCLAADPSHPEANRSMGMMRFFAKRFDEGVKYFEQEQALAYRRSTLALLKKQGKPINLYKLRKNAGRVPGKNYFEEVKLAKFTLPDLPMTVDEEEYAKQNAEGPLRSFIGESLFWSQAATEPPTEAEKQALRFRPVGINSDLVDELLEDLHNTYPIKNRLILTEDDVDKLKGMKDAYYDVSTKMQCPPDPPNASIQVLRALAKKCCEDHKPLTDALMAGYNGFIKRKFNLVQPRWKEYINGLINVVSLDPTPGRRRMVYAEVQEYFNFLTIAWQSAAFESVPVGHCDPSISTAAADSIIASARAINLHCPKGLNLEVDVVVAKIKGDCEKFELEFGKEVIVNFEKNFKTGTATLSTGFSHKLVDKGPVKAGAKLLGFISFDNDWNYADFGVKAKVEGGIKTSTPMIDDVTKGNTWVVGGEANFSLGLESGFKANAKGKGIIAEFEALEYKSK